jgi:hypothetical protein
MSQTFDFNKTVQETNAQQHTLNLHHVNTITPDPNVASYSIVQWNGVKSDDSLSVNLGSLTMDIGMVALTNTSNQTVYCNFNNVTDFYAHESGNTKINFVNGDSIFVTQSMASINTTLGI